MTQHSAINHAGLTGVGSVATDAIFDAKGDLAAGTGANTASKLTVGANDTILMADSGQSTGLKWVAAATPTDQDYDDVAAAGTSDTFARGDHLHGMPSAGGGGVTRVGCKVTSTGVSISAAVITFTTEAYDTHGFHDNGSNTSRMTIPTGQDGLYLIQFNSWTSRTDARPRIYVNGSVILGGDGRTSTDNFTSALAVYPLVATDYVEIFANTVASTTFGGSGSEAAIFSITKLAD